MKSKFLATNLVRAFFSASKGKFLSVKFKKLDGSVRVMNCKGSSLSSKKKKKSNKSVLTVFDLKKFDFRSFRADRVLEMKVNGSVLKAV